MRFKTKFWIGTQVLISSFFLFLPNPSFAQDFQKCIAMGIPRHTCEDAIVATSPDSDAGKEALHSAIEREVHKNDPSWNKEHPNY